MSKHIGLGRLGENIAVHYLEKEGHRIIERNYRKRYGELDVVALAPDKTLVFVEVKTVSGPEPRIAGEDQMTTSKLKKLRRMAEIYANNEKDLSNRSWRIDLITITTEGKEARVRHYKNI
ncbi:MAG: hypothetical protein COT89_01865 [Candidatus Colwellbacteria bacterium CG10_big_fil_rev_8_21_14_0_10_42_22]|uniref:UPF0102 protein COT89_01865 n=1 Tax=Candidatus Colwellbacteria bacterium CG10_big_fil_rev_8_21_14_0_10_42_22 TaxID=1974540 RepID=A0A2H0VFU3_9BACT|nr:MAG: hypothetical protein COT89_01865 [Candidatus Colwellbacteria bacterium CG10_big_fil_rev_8_21_14_0_10_42_22]